jgi:hypothetical protein
MSTCGHDLLALRGEMWRRERKRKRKREGGKKERRKDGEYHKEVKIH